MTLEFYKKTVPMIEFREQLTNKYNRNFMNHNDTKIGKDYFIMRLEEEGIPVYIKKIIMGVEKLIKPSVV